VPVPRVEVRVIPVKKSRDDDDVRDVASDIRLSIPVNNLQHDEDTERQLYSRLSEF